MNRDQLLIELTKIRSEMVKRRAEMTNEEFQKSLEDEQEINGVIWLAILPMARKQELKGHILRDLPQKRKSRVVEVIEQSKSQVEIDFERWSDEKYCLEAVG